jgi:DNA-binding IclR family transcriptional regulator
VTPKSAAESSPTLNRIGVALEQKQVDPSTVRVVAVLEALARGPDGGVGVRQLAADLSLSRSVVHRILQTLAEIGIARALPSGTYQVGATLAAWGAFLANRHDLLSAASHIMERLVEDAQETAYLLVFDVQRDSLQVVAARHCHKPVRYILEIGSVAPLHSGAAGKAVLAHLPAAEVARIDVDESGSHATRSSEQLLADLAESRRRGYAVSFGEQISDACGIATAFFVDGSPAGALTLTVPSFRMRKALVKPYGALVKGAANELSAFLG